jgi:D-lactate dehydrogenase (cytochrome)
MTTSFQERAKLLDRLGSLVGESNCLTDVASLEDYLVEPRGLFKGQAMAVVRPDTPEAVAAVVSECAMNRVPVVAQGGNTGMCGGGVPVGGPETVIVSTERLTRIRRVDPDNMVLVAESGCILADVQNAAKDQGCFFPLSLGAEGSCRIGGNLSTNAGGINVLRYGNARDLTLGLEVVLPDGTLWHGLRSLRKDNTGYALKHLFIGAEGTLGIITAACLKLFPAPRDVRTALVAIDNPTRALSLFNRLRRAVGDDFSACELLPRECLDLGFKHMSGGRDPFNSVHPWYLLVEMTSSRENSLNGVMETALEEAADEQGIRDAVVAQSETQRRAIWRLREIGAAGHQFQEGAIVKHDIALPLDQIATMIERGTREVEHAVPGTRVLAFGHMGDGNLHFNLVQPLGMDPKAFLQQQRLLNRIVHDIVDHLGGSVSAEHGIGMLKVDEMARYKSRVEIDLMQKIKRAIDPSGLMNPGKVLPPWP